MVYRMDFYVDGGCRGNGRSRSIGAAACLLMKPYNRGYRWKARRLDPYPRPTNQRAELTAIIMALDWALQKYDALDYHRELDVRIYTDSRYAVGCMTRWIDNWIENGWRTSDGTRVANRDLIEEAAYMDDRLAELGSVRYIWIPRAENEDADRHCNDELDDMEQYTA
ncbi:ribonuclease H-like domain-containing protein [Nemania sp. NC0429]|nr:ribonuclease H-like domain-containing protein [Nemania sp. NC0429]